MNIKHCCLWLLTALLTFHQGIASDTTYHKKPVYASLRLGYTSTRAFGSLPDMTNDQNNQYGARNASQKDGGAFGFNFSWQVPLSDPFFIETGIGYLQRQVNPEEGGFMLYKDSLKTGYLSIPVLAGGNVALNHSGSISLLLEAGLSGNVALVNRTTYGIDRAGFKTLPVVLDLQLGTGINFATSDKSFFFLRYNFISDLTHAYKEQLYWGAPNELIRTRFYQLRTSYFSAGLQWAL